MRSSRTRLWTDASTGGTRHIERLKLRERALRTEHNIYYQTRCVWIIQANPPFNVGVGRQRQVGFLFPAMEFRRCDSRTRWLPPLNDQSCRSDSLGALRLEALHLTVTRPSPRVRSLSEYRVQSLIHLRGLYKSGHKNRESVREKTAKWYDNTHRGGAGQSAA